MTPLAKAIASRLCLLGVAAGVVIVALGACLFIDALVGMVMP